MVEIRKVLVIFMATSPSTWPYRDELLNMAKNEGFSNIKFVFSNSMKQTIKEIANSDVAFVSKGTWNAEMFGAAKKLSWVHAERGGIDGQIFPEFLQSSIPFTCLKPIFGIAGAETALGAILLFSRRLNYLVKPLQGQNRLKSHDIPLPEELSGKTVGIVGLGNMGRALVPRVRSLGMRVLATARRIRKDSDGVDQMFATEELPEMLKTSDFVVVSVPLTADTNAMVGKSFLKSMKPSAFLIDLSGRPQIYKYGAIVTAIREKWIAGVCLQPSDYEPEVGMPLPTSSFWELENVVVTPYRITSLDMEKASLKLFFENLRRIQNGEPLEGLVDKVAGY